MSRLPGSGVYAGYPTVVSKTSAYTAGDGEVVIADATGGAFTVSLPAVATVDVGACITVVRTNSGGNAVTIDPAGSETVDGSSTISLASQFGCAVVISDGVAWHSAPKNGTITYNPASQASSAITYDHTVSGLTATDVKAALDELAATAADHETRIAALETP